LASAALDRNVETLGLLAQASRIACLRCSFRARPLQRVTPAAAQPLDHQDGGRPGASEEKYFAHFFKK